LYKIKKFPQNTLVIKNKTRKKQKRKNKKEKTKNNTTISKNVNMKKII